MKCANCGNILITVDCGRLEADYCIECGGIWLDSGELELLLGIDMPDKKALTTVAPQLQTKRKCPICGRKMCGALAGDQRQVELDSCTHGHGLWFDRGELESIIQLFSDPIRDKLAAELKTIFPSPHRS